jgi:hypothetical protein
LARQKLVGWLVDWRALWKEAASVQRAGDSEVNMKVKLHQENKAIVAN